MSRDEPSSDGELDARPPSRESERPSTAETAAYGRGEVRRHAETERRAPFAAPDASSSVAPGGPSTPTFAAGEVVAERYQIVAFIARGGSGEVYEVEDLALGGRVALKTVRPDRESGEMVIERFKREVQLARQVTHPNVCRLYEYGQHVVAGRGATAEKILFLTMELLSGPTLEERIRREGPMSLDEALPLLRQLASGLEAAHRAGVVHRDFKSANVILVPTSAPPDGTLADVRAAITDFGLARGLVRAGDPRLTRPHRMVGTPAYMAPEQVRGEEATVASDIYALGVVLFEMLTDSLPFDGGTAMETAIMRLTTPPPSPAERRPDLAPRWAAVVLRCLERAPEDRFAHPLDLVATLDSEPVGTGDGAEWARPVLLALGLTLVAIAIFWLVFSRADAYHTRSIDAPSSADGVVEGAEATKPARPSIAVLDFDNRSDRAEDEWLGTALAEMLAMELGAGDKLRVVSGTEVARVSDELDVDLATGGEPEARRRLADRLGADLLAVGSYVAAGPASDREVRLDVTVTTDGGDVLGRHSERAQAERLLDLVEGVGRALRTICGVDTLSPEALRAVRAGLPGGTEAARLYAEGVEAMHLHRHQVALEKLRRAVELEPGNPIFRSLLSEAWHALGYRRAAADEARRAVELSGSLGPLDRLEVEARWHVLEGRLDEAADDYAMLREEAPDDPQTAFALIDVLADLSRGEDARALFESLQRHSAGSALEPRLALAEAKVAHALGDAPETRRAAAESSRTARALGARLLAAEALELEASAWRAMGEGDKALAALEEARAIYADAGHRGATARVIGSVAKVLRLQGRLDQARALAEEARAVASEIGDQRTLKSALNTLAVILRQQGRPLEALDIHRVELETTRRIGDVFGEQVARTSIGTVELQLGELDDARQILGEALDMSRAAGNARSIALNAGLLGEVHFEQAQLEEASALFEEALALHRESSSRRGEAFELTNLGRVAAERGDLETARRRIGDALAIRTEIGERTSSALSTIDLGRLELLEGRPERAAALFGEAAQELSAEAVRDQAQVARALRAQALAESGDAATGLRLAESARAAVTGTTALPVRLRVGLASARALRAAGAGDEALSLLAVVADEAGRAGLRRLELEARIDAARLASDDQHLAELAIEAESLGLGRLAVSAR